MVLGLFCFRTAPSKNDNNFTMQFHISTYALRAQLNLLHTSNAPTFSGMILYPESPTIPF